MDVKVIRTKDEYDAALAEIEKLMDLDPEPGTLEADRFDLLTLLVKDYESKNTRIPPPDPIEAIEFRMEQQNLSQRDLIPYIGSRSKVSEVLSRRRPLTVSMMRSLHKGLGIPADVLLQDQSRAEPEQEIDWKALPIKEMIKRGWIKTTEAQADTARALQEFFDPVGPRLSVQYKQNVRSVRQMDEYALLAWTVRIVKRALENPPEAEYKPGTVTLDFMRRMARLSWSETGPCLAQEFLSKNGISLVIEPHLPHTHLDGAAILFEADWPIIGMTIRYDRVDNFWFALAHELAHISLHSTGEKDEFFDDLDTENPTDDREKDADDLAREALVPQSEWDTSPARNLRTPDAAQDLASRLGIHPAIVAGLIRHQWKSYRVLNKLIGQGQVRKCFPETKWSVGETNV